MKNKTLLYSVYVVLVIVLILINSANASMTKFISDSDYTNQDFTMMSVYKFCKSYKNNPLTYSDIEYVVRYAHVYKINPIVILTKMQMESDLLVRVSKNKTISYLKQRAMGYGMAKNFRMDGYKFYTYGGYQIQVFLAAKKFRELYDEWKPGMKKKVLDLDESIVPENAATYAIYRYTPFYGKHNYYGWKYDAVGNIAFEQMFPKFNQKHKEIYKKLKKK